MSATKAAEKKEGIGSTVVKRMVSLPVGLHKFAQSEAKRIAKEEGKRPNVSGFIASLLFQAKFAAASQPKPAVQTK